MTDSNYRLELEAKIHEVQRRILESNSRLDIVKMNCLLSEYNRLFSIENRELTNSNELSNDDIKKLEKEFHEFQKYKESIDYEGQITAYNNKLKDTDNSGSVFVNAHFRKPKSR